jgi:hypothetical protein
MSAARWWSVGILVAGLVSGCKCADHIIPTDNGDGGTSCTPGAPTCTTDDNCPERNVCQTDHTTGDKCCVRVIRKCVDDSQCCPGQICTNDGHCIDKFDACKVDGDCGETPDRVCREWKDPRLGSSMRCTYDKCGTGGACPAGQACFDGFCVVNAPCGGTCPAGSACVPQAAGGGLCHPFGSRCDLKPKPGYLVVFTKPDDIFDICLLGDEACQYAELPPLPATDLGRHPSVAVAGQSAVVAMYDGHYGDLVVSDFDLTGKKLKTVWVDGVPASGTLTGGPTGPRGGIGDPGDDVGKYTSIVARSDGTFHVAYYDQTHGDLRFATRAPDGTWASHLVDGAAADVGLYTSLALDADGKPAVAYFQRAGSDDPSVSCPAAPSAPKSLITGLKIARARVQSPKSSADWAVEMVACAARPAPPCYGCNGTGAKVCVQDATSKSGTSCQDPSTGCTPACASGQVCITGNVCAPQGSPVELLTIPWGTGLFPSLVFKAADPVIAYYDRTNGNLIVAQQSGGAWTSHLLDGEDANGDTGDVGMFPSLVIDSSGNYNIAYHDFTRRGLRFYTGATLVPLAEQRTPPPWAFIDTGIGDPKLDGPAYVGASAWLISTADGLVVAYQNATAGDLRLSRKTPDGWKQLQQWTEGALGFFAHVVPTGDGRLLVVHTRIHAKTAGSKPVPDNELRLEFVTP